MVTRRATFAAATTTASTTPVPRRRRTPSRVNSLGAVVVSGVALTLTFLFAGFGWSRETIALCAGGLLLLGIVRWPRESLFGLIGWLAALGWIRRMVTMFSPRGEFDPLLLLAPAAWLALVVLALRRGAHREQTLLSQAVLVLSVLIVGGMVNPLQNHVAAGVIGGAFVLVPVLAFWVGKAFLDDETFTVLVHMLIVMAAAAAAYGLVQTLVGFPHWDQLWIDQLGYAALTVRGVVRPFSSFASHAEYGLFLGIGLATCFASIRRLRALLWGVPVASLLATAAVYQSGRAVILLSLMAVAAAAAARRGFSIRGGTVGAIAMVGILLVAVGRYAPADLSLIPGGELLEHQIRGFSDPLNPESSSLGVHLDMVTSGIWQCFEHPLGVGMGEITAAGQKFGRQQGSTEADLSNVSVALGIPGLLAYVVVVGITFTSAYRIARVRRDTLALTALGILVMTLFQWLNDGHYLLSPLAWLMIGWIERERIDERALAAIAAARSRARSTRRVDPVRAARGRPLSEGAS